MRGYQKKKTGKLQKGKHAEGDRPLSPDDVDRLEEKALEEGLSSAFDQLRWAMGGLRFGYGGSEEPDEPTEALPGTEEKIQVMIERAKNGTSLFHKRDKQLKSKKGAKEKTLKSAEEQARAKRVLLPRRGEGRDE